MSSFRIAVLATLTFLAAACGGTPSRKMPPALKANGTVSNWQTLNPLLTPRANHCAAATQGHLYVLGGNYDSGGGNFVNIGTVDAAEIMPDGTLGAWAQAAMLPGPMSGCTATADATHLYIVDGIYDDDATYGGQLWSAPVASDGSVGSWISLGVLPNGLRVIAQQAWISGTRLIAMTSTASPDNTIVIEADLSGATASWSAYNWTSEFRGWPQYAFNGSFAWILGGYGDGATSVSSDGNGVALSSTGVPGQAFSVTMLPQATCAGDAAAVDGYLFLFGGKGDVGAGDSSAQVQSTPIASDGTLGSWSAQTPLPHGRVHLRATVAGDFIYVTGGGDDAGGLDTVYGAQIRF